MSPDREVLVVGGAGYVGSALTRALLARTDMRVRVLDALIYGHGNSLAGLAEEERFTFVRGDVRSDEDVAVATEGVSDVVLLAALVGDPVCKRNPEVAREVNVDGAKRVARLAAEGSPERFVFASTCSNYGLRDENDPPAVEGDELKPLSIYAENKVEVESHLLEDLAGGIDTTVMRVSTAYGMSQRMRFDLTVSEFTRELTLGNDARRLRRRHLAPIRPRGRHLRRHQAGPRGPRRAGRRRGLQPRRRRRELHQADDRRSRSRSARRGGRGQLGRGRGGRPELPGLLRQDQGASSVSSPRARCPARSRTSPRRSARASSTP